MAVAYGLRFRSVPRGMAILIETRLVSERGRPALRLCRSCADGYRLRSLWLHQVKKGRLAYIARGREAVNVWKWVAREQPVPRSRPGGRGQIIVGDFPQLGLPRIWLVRVGMYAMQPEGDFLEVWSAELAGPMEF
jgi:hypothetical protein